MKEHQFYDQLGRLVEFNFPPQRVVSLVPSQTELLYDLGLGDRVAGITKFCVHPIEWFETKPRVGGTKKFRFDLIDSLRPDLIIGNKEENYLEGINRLAEKYPVWMSDITSWDGALGMISSVGQLVDASERANQLVKSIRTRLQTIRLFSARRVLYLIWRNPWMAAGKDTFIDSVLSKTGLVNCVNEGRYPELSVEEMKILSPEIILLSSEPFPFQQENVEELKVIFSDVRIVLVDGQMFSWYGSRLLKSLDYFSSMRF